MTGRGRLASRSTFFTPEPGELCRSNWRSKAYSDAALASESRELAKRRRNETIPFAVSLSKGLEFRQRHMKTKSCVAIVVHLLGPPSVGRTLAHQLSIVCTDAFWN